MHKHKICSQQEQKNSRIFKVFILTTIFQTTQREYYAAKEP